MERHAEASELVDRLTGIDMEEREAKLFVHLVLHGAARASDAAAAVRLKRTETYRALESLVKRGFVSAHLTKPVVYEAVAPETVFAELLAGHEERRSEIERLREHVVAAAARAQRAESSGRYGYKIIQGRRAIRSAMEPAIRNARSGVAWASTTLDAASVSAQNRAYQALVRRAEDGLPQRVLLLETPSVDRVLEPFERFSNVKARLFAPDYPVRFLIADGREIFYWLVSDPSDGLEGRGDVAMWTNAPDFVRAHEKLFEVLWTDGRERRR